MAITFKNDRVKADAFIGLSLAALVIGRSFGGIFTVMFPAGLFLPLLPAAGVNIVALLVVLKYFLCPGCNAKAGGEAADDDAPRTLDKVSFANIVVGQLLDSVGSAGVVREWTVRPRPRASAFFACSRGAAPLAGAFAVYPAALGFSPVLYQTFYLNFQEIGQPPIMGINSVSSNIIVQGFRVPILTMFPCCQLLQLKSIAGFTRCLRWLVSQLHCK